MQIEYRRVNERKDSEIVREKKVKGEIEREKQAEKERNFNVWKLSNWDRK